MKRNTASVLVTLATVLAFGAAFATDVHHIKVKTSGGGRAMVVNSSGALPSPVSFTQVEKDAAALAGSQANWTSTEINLAIAAMAGSGDECLTLYRQVMPPYEYDCFGACSDCSGITVVGSSTGKATVLLSN